MEQLRQEVAELGKELKAASDQHVVARVGNLLAWEDALEILWVESWMTMKPFPKPDRFAKGDPADAGDAGGGAGGRAAVRSCNAAACDRYGPLRRHGSA